MTDAADLTSLFQLEELLSWQGTTRTFRGVHPETGESVAVKTLSMGAVPEAPAEKQRFLAGAGLLKGLDHPNLPSLLEFGVSAEGDAFLVFSWIEGQTLDRLGELAPRQVLPYVLQAIEGLECLALHGLVHLNLSPENLLVTREGEVKLLGLGSSFFRVDWQSPLGSNGSLGGGRSGISAPELRPSASAGGALWRADLYSLAFVTCGLLEAEVDDVGEDEPRVRLPAEAREHLHESENLERELARCLRGDPNRRPVSYSNFAKVLQHSLPRAPRAAGVVRDTQVFDLSEVEAPRAGAGPDGRDPQKEESKELLEMRSELEATLQGEKLKEPRDLGKEAEIYEGFLEIRSDREPVELTGADSEGTVPPPSGGTALPDPEASRETMLTAPPSAVDAETPRGSSQGSTSSAREPRTGSETIVAPRPPLAAQRGGASSARSEAPAASRSTVRASDRPSGVSSQRRRVTPSLPEPPAAPLADRTTRKPAGGTEARPGRSSPAGARDVATAPPPSAPIEGRRRAEPAAPSATARPPAKPSTAASRPARAGRKPTTAAVSKSGSAAVTSLTERVRDMARAAARPLGRVSGGAARLGRLDRRVLVVAASLSLLLVASLAAVILWPNAPRAEVPPVAVELPPLAPPAPADDPLPPQATEVSMPPALSEALLKLSEGDLLGARGLLSDLASAAEEGELGEAYEAYQAAVETVTALRAEEVTADLERALQRGDPDLLRRTVRELSEGEAERLSRSSEGRLLVADARRARQRLDAFEEAIQGDDRMVALDEAFRLADSFPSFGETLRPKERATAAVEEEADRMVEEGRLEEAQERLALLKATWPDRPGIDGRLETVRSRLTSEARFETLLEAAAAAGARQRPHEGLRMLQSTRPNRSYAPQFEALRRKLEAQLAELDGEAPKVRVRPGYEVEFRKGDPVIVQLQVEDDYDVEEVAFWARARETSDFERLPARRLEDGYYEVEISPDFHDNRPIEFWVSASDRSGHRGTLANAEEPLLLRRKRWFRG